MDSKRAALLFGAGAFVFALLVRLIGIGWGLPNELHNQSYHPDEPVIYAYSQQIEPTKLDFVPGFYNYGTLYLSLLRVTTDIVAGYGGGPANDSEAEYWRSVGRYHKAGRVLSALAGAGTVWIVLLMLWPRVGRFGALAGAAAMALAPGHVVHSRFQTVDVLATFFLAVSLYFCLRMLRVGEGGPPEDRSYMGFALWAGVFAGLSAGTKYTGILALVALAVVVLAERRGVSWRALLVGVAASLFVFVLTTPGAVLDSARFLNDFRYEMTHTQTGHGLVFAGTPNGFVFHLSNLFFALGLALTVLATGGLVRACVKRHAWAFALVAFALVYYVLIGRAEVKFLRYVFPLLPVLAVGFGWLVSRAHISPKPMVKGSVMFFAIFGIGGLDGGGGAMTASATAWMAGEDPRDQVARELKDLSDEGTVVGLTSDPWFYTPPLFADSALPRAVPFELRDEAMRSVSEPSVARFVPEDASARLDFDVRLLSELMPDYVVISSFEIGDLNRMNKLPSPPKGFETQVGRAEEFMDTLQTGYELWKVRGADGAGLPHDMMYVRPVIEVWRRKNDSTTPSPGTSTTSGPSGAPVPTP